jgi:MFS family permease
MFSFLKPKGMARFYVLWAGSLVSLFGATMTAFLIGILAYQKTQSTTAFAVVLVSYTLPAILLSPVAGALVDRWRRKTTMVVGVISVTISTSVIAWLIYWKGTWDWRVCLAIASISVVDAFITPAYFAVTALIVPKEQLVRANSCWQFNFAASAIIARPLSLLLMRFINIWGVIIVDVITYILVLISILLVDIPDPPKNPEDAAAKRLRFSDLAAGWSYITSRQGFVRLLAYMTMFRFAVYMTNTLFSPMILAMGASTRTLAIILSVGSIGSAVGTASLAAWGGPRGRIFFLLGAGSILGVGIMIAGLSTNSAWTAFGFLLFSVAGPLGGSCSQAVWQSKTDPAFQGRVSSLERMITQSTLPIACLVGGSLADKVFSPMLAPGGLLAAILGRFMGTGAGRGIGLLLVLVGLSALIATLAGYSSTRLRHLENDIADSAELSSMVAARAVENPAPMIQERAVANE